MFFRMVVVIFGSFEILEVLVGGFWAFEIFCLVIIE